MKNTVTTKTYRNVTISKTLQGDLDALGLTKIGRYKALYVIYKLMYNEKYHADFNPYAYKPLSRSYLVMMLGKYYYQTMNALRVANIIQSDDLFFSGKCLSYRINPEYTLEVDAEHVSVKFSYKTTVPHKTYLRNKDYKETFIEDLNALTIPFDELHREIDQHISEMSLEDFKINLDVEWKGHRQVNIWNKEKEKSLSLKMTLEAAMLEALHLDCDIIKDGAKVYIADVFDFFEGKKNNTRTSWEISVNNLANEDSLYSKRNTRNLRLDTNLTNLPSSLHDILMEHNGMVEADVVNSQPALLGLMMENDKVDMTSDYLENVYEGTLYETMMDALGMTRQEAKMTIFEVLFSTATCDTYAKKQFRKLFPDVWDYTVAFKKEHGYKELAVALQRLESSIFIDGVYNPLINAGVLCFTKHDSISCKIEDYGMVIELVKEVFDQTGFKGKIKAVQTIKAA